MWDSNSQPHAPKACALADCANFRKRYEFPYKKKWSGQWDSNSQPSAWKADALANWAMPAYHFLFAFSKARVSY